MTIKVGQNHRASICHRNIEIRHSKSQNMAKIGESNTEFFKNYETHTIRVTSDLV